jgi:hypothetical protein
MNVETPPKAEDRPSSSSPRIIAEQVKTIKAVQQAYNKLKKSRSSLLDLPRQLRDKISDEVGVLNYDIRHCPWGAQMPFSKRKACLGKEGYPNDHRQWNMHLKDCLRSSGLSLMNKQVHVESSHA